MVENTFPHYPQILYKLRTDNCEKLTTIYRKHTFYPQLINKLWTILEFSGSLSNVVVFKFQKYSTLLK